MSMVSLNASPSVPGIHLKKGSRFFTQQKKGAVHHISPSNFRDFAYQNHHFTIFWVRSHRWSLAFEVLHWIWVAWANQYESMQQTSKNGESPSPSFFQVKTTTDKEKQRSNQQEVESKLFSGLGGLHDMQKIPRWIDVMVRLKVFQPQFVQSGGRLRTNANIDTVE